MNEVSVNSVKSQPRLWERLQLIVGDDGREGVYNCRISDILHDYMMISRPEFAHGYSLLADNRKVTVNFVRPDASYSFTARIRECQPKSNREMMLVQLGEINRIQRRRFVRLEKIFDVGYRHLDQSWNADVDFKKEFNTGHCLNISAGGILFEAKDTFEVGQLLFLNFSACPFNNMPDFVLGVVRQSRQREDHNPACGVEFILREDLRYFFKENEEVVLPVPARIFDLKIQNELVNELFSVQLDLRRKGLL